MKLSASCAIDPANLPASNGRSSSVRLLEPDALAALAPARESEVRRRDVHRADAPAGVAAAQRERDAARAAADVEHRAIDGQVGEVDQDLGEPPAPAAEEALVGGPVVGMVGKCRHRQSGKVSRSRP